MATNRAIQIVASIGVMLWSTTALATPPPSADETVEEPAAAPKTYDVWYDLNHRDALFGEMGGLRPWLDKRGISIGLTETSEYLGNGSGGVRHGFAYDGLTTATLQVDTKKAFGFEGGLFNASALDIHGTNLSPRNLLNLQTASGIEADNGVRLWELWYQQSFGQSFDVKVGQQSLDQEFMVSSNALLFVNTMFGWAMLPSADMLSGGPAYPLSSPGIRFRGEPTDSITLLAGVFNDNPSGIDPRSDDDSQRLNRHGINFRVSDAPLVITELQYSFPSNGDMHYAGKAEPLPGTYRIGAWYDFGRFTDQKNDAAGLSLADPASDGVPALHHGNYSVYVVADQMIWRPNPEKSSGLSVFGRAMGAPEDRNLISFSLNAGLTYKGLIPGREDDTAGIGYGLAEVSSGASSLDQSTAFFSGTPYPERKREHFIEATYQYQLMPWIQIQPDFQYVFHVGGGIPNPDDPSNASRIGDEAIFGVRANITF